MVEDIGGATPKRCLPTVFIREGASLIGFRKSLNDTGEIGAKPPSDAETLSCPASEQFAIVALAGELPP